jgi:integrase
LVARFTATLVVQNRGEHMALTVKRVAKLIRAGVPGRHTDGAGGVRGLMLCVESKSSAHWLLRYQRDKVIRHMGLGSARDLSLAAAREKASIERERIARDIDPLELRRKERDARKAAEAKQITFKQAAERFHEAHEASWTNSRHRDEFLNSLRRWTYPHIGDADVAAIDRDAVLRVLEQKLPSKMGKDAGGGTLWVQRAITADRVRNRIERVLDFATVRGFRTGDNPARWRGYLEEALPAPRKLRPIRGMAAVPYDQVPGLMQLLAADQTVGAQALRFLVLTASRLGEALKATWDEIDLEAAEWVIPAARMKGRKEHRVPLSPQAMELLRSLYREENNRHLFISTRTPGAHVVATTVTIALRNAGRKETIHGFRASFKTWGEESTSFPGLVIELSLAHAPGTLVERSYRRGDVIVKRRKLMEAWGKYCTTPSVEKQKGDKVVPLRGGGERM